MDLGEIVLAIVSIIVLGALVPIGGGVAWTDRWTDTLKGIGAVLAVMGVGALGLSIFR